MLLGGRKLTAIEAHQWGLVTDVIPHDSFQEEIERRVQALGKLPPKVNKLKMCPLPVTACFFISPQNILMILE